MRGNSGGRFEMDGFSSREIVKLSVRKELMAKVIASHGDTCMYVRASMKVISRFLRRFSIACSLIAVLSVCAFKHLIFA